MSRGFARSVHGGIVAKLAAWLVALALVALPIVGVLSGQLAGDRWPFRQLRIDAAFSHVNAEQVQMAVAPVLDRGFFAVDLGAVQAAVERLPWVAHAEVAKRWPDELIVKVVEHAPIARFVDGRLVAADGSLFAVEGDLPEGLPLLDCPESRIADILQLDRTLVRDLQSVGLVRDELHLSARGSVSVHLTTGAALNLGREALPQRMARFLAVWPSLAAPNPGGELLSADLRYSNGFALAWSMPLPVKPAAAPSAPRPASPLPSTPPPAAPVKPATTTPAAPEQAPNESETPPPNGERRA
jgi:cell division protein FtsQ